MGRGGEGEGEGEGEGDWPYLSAGHFEQESLGALLHVVASTHDGLVHHQHEVVLPAAERHHVTVLVAAHQALGRRAKTHNYIITRGHNEERGDE